MTTHSGNRSPKILHLLDILLPILNRGPIEFHVRIRQSPKLALELNPLDALEVLHFFHNLLVESLSGLLRLFNFPSQFFYSEFEASETLASSLLVVYAPHVLDLSPDEPA